MASKAVYGPMQLVIEGTVYGVLDGFDVLEGGIILNTQATPSGGKSRSGEYQLWEISGGSFDPCVPLPEDRCGLAVTVVLLANRNVNENETLRSISLFDADINGRPQLAAGGNGAISGVSIVACSGRYNYGGTG